MQRADIERLFQMACGAFPRADVTVFFGGSPLMHRDGADCGPQPAGLEMRKEASTFTYEGRAFYRVLLPLPPSCRILLCLNASDYSSAAIPMRMLDSLAAEVMRGAASSSDGGAALRGGGSQLLDSLLRADTIESKVYAFLLAEEQGKDLEIPRVLCALEGVPARSLDEAARVASRFRETDEQDIVGVTGEGRLVICRRAGEGGLSVKSGLDGYLRALAERIGERCGFTPEIMAGTLASQPEEYRASLEAALVAGEWARAEGRAGGVHYASDYILEYTFEKTEPPVLRHFLAPYAERLRSEPELVDTAEALVESDMNIIAAAERLFVHRNTVTLRLSRLRALLEIDPMRRDSDKFLLMMLCAYYRRYC